jgi:hypothetical protein
MTNLDMRLVYDNAKVALRKAFPELTEKGIDVAEVCKLTQSDYRFEQPLVAGQGLYTFPVLVNQQVTFPTTEFRLKQQDSAVIYQLGIFVGLGTGVNDNTFMLDTYPVPLKYGANAIPMNSIWNGTMKITVNNDVLVPNWDVMKHYNAPETQATAAPAAGSPIDQFRGGFDGFYPMEPNVTLIGSKDNTIQIILPVGPATVTANTRIIIIARTIVAQNSTVVS